MNVRSYSVQPGDNYWLLAQRYNISVHDICAVNPWVDPHNLFIGQNIQIPLKFGRSTECISPQEAELMGDMRSLWEEHIAWTRMTMISLIFNLPDADEVITRLLQNATDMGDALAAYYGPQIGKAYGDLVREHLTIAADLVNAAIAGDQQATMTAENNWYRNADEIISFWSSINPYLSEEEVRKMFYTHLELTKTEAILMIQKEFEKDIQVYDQIQEQALGMADAFTEAIVKQFPDMFRFSY